MEHRFFFFSISFTSLKFFNRLHGYWNTVRVLVHLTLTKSSVERHRAARFGYSHTSRAARPVPVTMDTLCTIEILYSSPLGCPHNFFMTYNTETFSKSCYVLMTYLWRFLAARLVGPAPPCPLNFDHLFIWLEQRRTRLSRCVIMVVLKLNFNRDKVQLCNW